MANPFASAGGEVESKSEGWNVAEGFTQQKILKPLIEMDKLVKIAIYGSETIEGAVQISQQPELKVFLRIEALNRLIDTLRETIENSRFAMNKTNVEVLDALEQRVFAVASVLGAISKETIDMRNNNGATVINEEHFFNCLEELRKIKKEIPEPLNKSSLIFPSSEEVDLSSLKQNIIEGG